MSNDIARCFIQSASNIIRADGPDGQGGIRRGYGFWPGRGKRRLSGVKSEFNRLGVVVR